MASRARCAGCSVVATDERLLAVCRHAEAPTRIGLGASPLPAWRPRGPRRRRRHRAGLGTGSVVKQSRPAGVMSTGSPYPGCPVVTCKATAQARAAITRIACISGCRRFWCRRAAPWWRRQTRDCGRPDGVLASSVLMGLPSSAESLPAAEQAPPPRLRVCASAVAVVATRNDAGAPAVFPFHAAATTTQVWTRADQPHGHGLPVLPALPGEVGTVLELSGERPELAELLETLTGCTLRLTLVTSDKVSGFVRDPGSLWTSIAVDAAQHLSTSRHGDRYRSWLASPAVAPAITSSRR